MHVYFLTFDVKVVKHTYKYSLLWPARPKNIHTQKKIKIHQHFIAFNLIYLLILIEKSNRSGRSERLSIVCLDITATARFHYYYYSLYFLLFFDTQSRNIHYSICKSSLTMQTWKRSWKKKKKICGRRNENNHHYPFYHCCSYAKSIFRFPSILNPFIPIFIHYFYSNIALEATKMHKKIIFPSF